MQRKLFALVFSITGTKTSNPMPPSDNHQDLAREFATFFTDKVKNIIDGLTKCDMYKPTVNEYLDSGIEKWKHPTEDHIKYIVNTMPNKQSEIDKIPTSIIKKDAKLEQDDYVSICGALSVILTKCIENNYFPTAWKCALVKPLIKNSSLDLKFKNYRPVSNLPFTSKIFEKLILLQLNKHMNTNCLLPEYQSAYRENHSCETCLVDLLDDILWSMERKHCVALACIDLSAAFDLVNRDILIDILEKKFGISDDALQLLRSYVGPRGFRVKVGEELSDYSDLHQGVAQGSCLGPVLYSCYASTLQDVVSEEINIHGFADDHSFKKEFKPSVNESTSVASLEDSLKSVKTWMDANRLKMNDGKTEFIIFGSKRMLQQCQTEELDVNSVTVTKSPCIKLLGANLDQDLNFKTFIGQKCRKAWLVWVESEKSENY